MEGEKEGREENEGKTKNILWSLSRRRKKEGIWGDVVPHPQKLKPSTCRIYHPFTLPKMETEKDFSWEEFAAESFVMIDRPWEAEEDEKFWEDARDDVWGEGEREEEDWETV